MNCMGSKRTNKRPIELQIMKELSPNRFQKDMKISLKKEFQGDFLEFCHMKKIFPQMRKMFPLPTGGRSMTF